MMRVTPAIFHSDRCVLVLTEKLNSFVNEFPFVGAAWLRTLDVILSAQ